MRILLIEDEVAIAKPLAKMLEKSGIASDVVHDGLSGYIQAIKDIYDVIILDLMLPEMNGLEVLKKMRQEGVSTPTLILTAKDLVEDKIRGLEYGADDYLTKPFNTEELLARVKALARRNVNIVNRDLLKFGDLELDVSSLTLSIDGQTQVLTAKESHLLEILIINKNVALSKEYLLDKIWGIDSEAIENTVEIYVHYLRKKLAFSKKVKIVTKRGAGYIIKEVCDA